MRVLVSNRYTVCCVLLCFVVFCESKCCQNYFLSARRGSGVAIAHQH